VEPQVPARLECPFRHPEIAVGHDPGLARPDHHLPIFASGQQIVIFVNNRHFVMREHDPARMIPLRNNHPARIGRAIATAGKKVEAKATVEIRFRHRCRCGPAAGNLVKPFLGA
jgi:hypothetical protein